MALRDEDVVGIERLRPLLDRMAAEAAAELYGPDGMPWGTPFEELEDRAYELGQALARRLVRELVAEQAEEEVPEEFRPCPSCGRRVAEPAAEAVDGEADDDEAHWEARCLESRSGEVPWHEPRRYCPACRRAFFPSVEGFGDRPLEVQPGGVEAGGVRRPEGGVRRGE